MLLYTVKPLFTALRFTVNPDVPHLKTFPGNVEILFYHPRLWTRDPRLIKLSDWIPGIMQAYNALQITYTPYLRVNQCHKHWLSAIYARRIAIYPCDPDYWNPNLPFIPIYHTFFRSPKLCGISRFYYIVIFLDFYCFGWFLAMNTKLNVLVLKCKFNY